MQVAATKARTDITKRFPDEYAKLYLELRAKYPDRFKSFAQSRAKTILINKYPEVYKELRKRALQDGHPATYKCKRHKV